MTRNPVTRTCVGLEITISSLVHFLVSGFEFLEASMRTVFTANVLWCFHALALLFYGMRCLIMT